MLDSPHLILTLVLLGPGIIAGYIFLKKIQQNRVHLTEPFEEDSALRLPGHSLLEKIEKTHEEVADKILFLIFPTLIHALVFYVFFEQRSANEWTFVFLFGIETGVIALLGFRLWRLLKELQCFRQGFRGEVFVSQILQPLTLMGYRVYHDLEFGDNKIDHILMNDCGIFCLETEIPQKRKTPAGKTSEEVIYDGTCLQFPWGKETDCLKQLQRNASFLAKYLREQTGQSIPIYPILLLPGWNINRTAKSSINVINPRELPAGLFYFPDFPLSEGQIEEIDMVLSKKSLEHVSPERKAS